MIDHISLRVADYERSKEFYRAALTPLGYELAMETASSGAGFSKGYIPSFWVKQREATDRARDVDPTPQAGCGGPQLHVAFASDSREMVDAFHTAAINAGARDNGLPRVRPEYHANYYGAFVLDPDGHNIEAVCHKAAAA